MGYLYTDARNDSAVGFLHGNMSRTLTALYVEHIFCSQEVSKLNKGPTSESSHVTVRTLMQVVESSCDAKLRSQRHGYSCRDLGRRFHVCRAKAGKVVT